jgi:NAD(P)-dependent dehydrogenase (short-subunit alcohol dehydrogenase family)
MTKGEQMAQGDLDGKVAIVTGAAGGIGSETARVLVGAGASVVLADLPGAPLDEAEATMSDPSRAATFEVDIADEAKVTALVAFAIDRFGGVDVLHNNAARQGVAEDRDICSMDVDVWDSILSVNARGCMLMCKHTIPSMIDRGGGSIINMSSGTSISGDMGISAYAASKGAINTITKYVATQYGSKGVRCNAVLPGLVATPTLEKVMPPAVVDVFVKEKPLGRLGEPRDIAELVLFLASHRSSYITGTEIVIDGGFLAHVPTISGIEQLMAQMPQG